VTGYWGLAVPGKSRYQKLFSREAYESLKGNPSTDRKRKRAMYERPLKAGQKKKG